MFAVNFAVMAVLNGVYLYVSINDANQYSIEEQIGLAMFKLFWNNFVLTELLKTIDKKKNNVNKTKFHTFLGILNFLVIPLLAVIFVVPKCFYGVWFQSEAVYTSFAFDVCDKNLCGSITESYGYYDEAYDPPFFYSYQCSSKYLTYYVAPYVYMFIYIGFLGPLFEMVLKYLYDVGFFQITWIAWIIKKLNISVEAKIMPAMLLPVPLDPNNPVLPPGVVLLDQEGFIVKIVTYLGAYLVFGVTFPPLAVVIWLSSISSTYFIQMKMGRVLKKAQDTGLSAQYEKQLNEELKGFRETLRIFTLPMMPVVSAWYAFVLFDVLAPTVNNVGTEAGWMPSIMFSLPFMTFACVWIVQRVQGSKLYKEFVGMYFPGGDDPIKPSGSNRSAKSSGTGTEGESNSSVGSSCASGSYPGDHANKSDEHFIRHIRESLGKILHTTDMGSRQSVGRLSTLMESRFKKTQSEQALRLTIESEKVLSMRGSLRDSLRDSFRDSSFRDSSMRELSFMRLDASKRDSMDGFALRDTTDRQSKTRESMYSATVDLNYTHNNQTRTMQLSSSDAMSSNPYSASNTHTTSASLTVRPSFSMASPPERDSVRELPYVREEEYEDQHTVTSSNVDAESVEGSSSGSGGIRESHHSTTRLSFAGEKDVAIKTKSSMNGDGGAGDGWGLPSKSKSSNSTALIREDDFM